MNHIAIIQAEFLKAARKWDDLTLEEQKGYLKRHPASKRKLTAKPESGSKVKEKLKSKKQKIEKNKDDSENSRKPKALSTLGNKSKEDIQAEIDKLETKMQKNMNAAIRKEQRARGDLDGTAIEMAYEKNKPLEVRMNLLKHYLTKGNKALPKELENDLQDLQRDADYKKQRKEEKNNEKEKHAHLVGKNITWKSRKYPGKEFSGRVVEVKSGKKGVLAKTDTGWRIPVELITKTTEAPKSEKTKTPVKAKDLIGKTITWKTKYNPYKRVRRHGLSYTPPAPPGYDPKKGTATGVVESASGSKLNVGTWKIPLGLVHELDGKKFERWQ